MDCTSWVEKTGLYSLHGKSYQVKTHTTEGARGAGVAHPLLTAHDATLAKGEGVHSSGKHRVSQQRDG